MNDAVKLFVGNPVKVTVGVLLVALFGIISVFRMPMQLTPEVQTPTLTIETKWIGASPQEIEREIIQEQEEQLKSVEGVAKMSSESMDSMGKITLEFAIGTNMAEALLKVNSRLQQVPEYPEEADEPVISTSNSSDRPIAWFILSARMPRAEDIQNFMKIHPELAASVQDLAGLNNPGLALFRLRNLVKENPVYAELLPPDRDVTKMRRFAEDVIEARFERVEGVSNANVLGGLEEELQVVVDPELLAARQLTIADVRNTLRGQNKDTSAGDFWEGKRRYVVRTMGQFRSPEQVAAQILAVRDGKPVYVHDVAEVRNGFKKPDGMVRRFGTSSIAVNCLRETGANVLDVMDGLREATKELNEVQLAAQGLELNQVYDETEYIHSAIGLVRDNIFVGGFLTILVLLLFLRSAHSTFVIMLAIPTSIVGTFLIMNMMGRSLNVISLAGLSFAVGMLVDNAIVVLENIYRKYEQGEPPMTAAVNATAEVWGAVNASTLTTLAVFLPVLLIEEEAGQLFRDIAIAISAAVGLSLIVSVTLIPTAAARILPKREPKATEDEAAPANGHHEPANGHTTTNAAKNGSDPGPETTFPKGNATLEWLLAPLDWLANTFVENALAINRWALRSWARQTVMVLCLVTASCYLTYLLWPKVEYLPNGNRNLVFGILLPPPGYNLNQLAVLGETVEEELRPYWDLDPTSEKAKELKYPAIGDFFFVARGKQVFIGVRAVDSMRAGELVPLVRQTAMKLPGTFAIAAQSSLFEQGLTAGRTIDIEITGPELPQLVQIGGRIMGQLSTHPKLKVAQAFPKPSLDLSSPEMHITPRLVTMAELGVNAADLGYTVNALVDGAYATDYFLEGTKIDLTILGKESFAARTQDLQNLPIAVPTGQLVPLSALGDVKLTSGPEQVNRRERQRAITIQVSPPPDLPLEVAMQAITKDVVEPLKVDGSLRGGYFINLAGTSDKLRTTWEALKWNLILALLITYLLMAALFESWLYPWVIILSVPLGAVGGVVGLWVLNLFVLQTLDVLTMLGFVILIGTVVNNPILIVDQSLQYIRDNGMTPLEAVLESTRTRIRPIFMTTMTTVIGLLPLVCFPGAGSELYRGLGSVLLGGLLISTIFTLYLIPSVFLLMMHLKESFLGLFRQRVPAPVPNLPPPAPASSRRESAKLTSSSS